MKPRSIKVSDEQWERWALEAAEVGVDRSTYVRNAVDAFGEDTVEQAQEMLDVKNEEIARLKRELGEAHSKDAKPGKTVLPARKFICSECKRLNIRGHCAAHPTAKQRPV